MRTGTTISAVAHGAVLAFALFSFGVKPLEVTPAESMPIDLISMEDFSKLRAGAKSAPKAPDPKPLVEKVAERKPAEDPKLKVVDKAEVLPDAQAPAPPPDRKETEKKAEAKRSLEQAEKPERADKPAKTEKAEKPKVEKAEKTEKKEPEPKIDPVAEALKRHDIKKPEKDAPKKQELAKSESVKTEQKSSPQERKIETPQPKFDADRIAALLDKRTPQRLAAAGDVLNRTASLGTNTGQSAQLTQSEIDALRARIQQCWNPPVGVAEAKGLVVQVRILLNQDGSLSAQPSLLNRGSDSRFQAAADSALRAVRRCAPYSFLPAAKYEVWKDVEITFDPREMLRG